MYVTTFPFPAVSGRVLYTICGPQWSFTDVLLSWDLLSDPWGKLKDSYKAYVQKRTEKLLILKKKL